MECTNPKAQEILEDLKSIIDEQEKTITQQQGRISDLHSKVNSLVTERDDLKLKLSKMETVIQNNSNNKKHKRRVSSGKKLNHSSYQQSNGKVEELMPSKLEKSSSVERSGSFQRKHLEEHDANMSRAEKYELSSDIRDRQVEALRNFYGGAETSERAARVIQEAYRSFMLKNQFKKIRRSNTRRLTIDTLRFSDPKDTGSMRRCKSVGHAESEEHDNSCSELSEKSFKESEPSANEQKPVSSSENVAEVSEMPVATVESPDEKVTPEKPPSGRVDVSDFSNEELVSRILEEAPVTNVVRRKKRHGYETIVFPNQTPPADPAHAPTTPEPVVVRLRRPPVQNQLSLAPSEDGEIPIKHEAADWLHTSSRISLISSENDPDVDSLRSSDTASIASDMSHFTMDYPGFQPSHFRRSMLSVRGSLLFDSDVFRKRLYRIGLNLFNMKPAKGLKFLMDHKFVGESAPAVASFLLNRKGLSRQMVGEYLGNTQKVFNQEVLDSVCDLMDFSNLELDEALRLFQSQIKVQGEAQKVERLVEAYSQRYCTCNPKMIESLHNPDSIFVLAFAIIMLNTDLHSPNMKHEKRMTEHDFVKNLKGVDNGDDLSDILLKNIYNRIKTKELTTMDDHMTSVLQIENSIVGKKPVLAVPHRRLVCFVRMFQVIDPTKPQRHGLHQREVFLFNDMMLVMKILHKKKSGTTYTLKQSISLHGLSYLVFESTNYSHGIRFINSLDNTALINFNAPNETDRKKFVNDVKESISEVQQMEALRIEAELEKAHSTSPTEKHGYGFLSVDSKKLSTSMHNLNQNKLLSVAKNGSSQRPVSMYNFNGNNNNNNTSTPKTILYSRSKSPISGNFVPSFGNFFRTGLKRHGPISSLVASSDLAAMTYTPLDEADL